ncbi:hypothetical protein F5Y18DRAFT_423522 [Xylariaceae sp. FL1019]|nr:hypothetical protein F5Y18DRAFT_423522 [Xylariaceae sp. FL1019]
MRWDEAKDRQLIHAVIHSGTLLNPSPGHRLGRVNGWPVIHRVLEAEGFQCSCDAIQSRFVKVHRRLEQSQAVIPQGATAQQALSILSGISIDDNVHGGDDAQNQPDDVHQPPHLSIDIDDNFATVSIYNGEFTNKDVRDMDFVRQNVARMNDVELNVAHRELTGVIMASQWVKVHRDLAAKLATAVPDDASHRQKLTIASGVPINDDDQSPENRPAPDEDEDRDVNEHLPNISIDGDVAVLLLHSDRFDPETSAVIDHYESNLREAGRRWTQESPKAAYSGACGAPSRSFQAKRKWSRGNP